MKQLFITLSAIALCLSCILSVSGCKKDDSRPGVESMKFDATAKSVQVGDSVTLTLTITPEDAEYKDVLTVSSSEKSVASASLSGKTVTVTGLKAGKSTVTVKANSITASCEITVFNGPDYFYFEAVEAGAVISMKKGDDAPEVTLEYSTDGKKWSAFNVGSPSTQATLSNTGGRIYFRAGENGNSCFANSYDRYNCFTSTAKVNTGGNIMYLLDRDSSKFSTLTAPHTFENLFNGMKIVDASGLVLPAVNLTNYCYELMFTACTDLTVAPGLPATELATCCYESMFEGCTALTAAPSLNAGTLKESCYCCMFKGCTSLTAAPVLNAVTLVADCYWDMFNGCSKLSSVTMLATDVSADSCLDDWLKDAGTDASVKNPKVKVANASMVKPVSDNTPLTWTVTSQDVLPEGSLHGLFTVDSVGKMVRFSRGNLQATIDASGNPTAWKFAAHQCDTIGKGGANMTIGKAAGDIDFFGWSTDGGTTPPKAYKKWGINTATNNTDYPGNFKDWGIAYCQSKGISPDTVWCTLSNEEYKYLLNIDGKSGRTDANRFAKANVNGVKGLLIFPDGYTGTASGTGIATVNTAGAAFPTSKVSDDIWSAMESAGCVFLPAAGNRYGSSVYSVGESLNYWSSTGSEAVYAYYLYSSNSDLYTSRINRECGHSVRLVTEAQ